MAWLKKISLNWKFITSQPAIPDKYLEQAKKIQWCCSRLLKIGITKIGISYQSLIFGREYGQ